MYDRRNIRNRIVTRAMYGDTSDTGLGDYEKGLYESWVKGFDIPDGKDSYYDMKGYFKDNILQGRDVSGVSDFDGKRHFPDTYKKPGHPSFSKESKYWREGMPNREWVGEKLFDRDTGRVEVDATGGIRRLMR
jgi:hypothetical protein